MPFISFMAISVFWTIHHLYNWQTLFGSALGSCVAISIPVGSFWLRRLKEKKENLEAALRRIEIEVTMMLGDVSETERELSKAIELIAGTIKDVNNETNPNAYHIGACNFPISGDIFRDHELVLLKTGSNYLHNKLLVIDARIKTFNKQLAIARDDFSELKKSNQLLTMLEKNPLKQREAYAENLKSFSFMLSMFKEQWIPIILTLLMQAKIYNLRLIKGYKKTKEQFENKNTTKSESERMDEIDKLLEKEVKENIDTATSGVKEREELILQNLPPNLKRNV